MSEPFDGLKYIILASAASSALFLVLHLSIYLHQTCYFFLLQAIPGVGGFFLSHHLVHHCMSQRPIITTLSSVLRVSTLTTTYYYFFTLHPFRRLPKGKLKHKGFQVYLICARDWTFLFCYMQVHRVLVAACKNSRLRLGSGLEGTLLNDTTGKYITGRKAEKERKGGQYMEYPHQAGELGRGMDTDRIQDRSSNRELIKLLQLQNLYHKK
ncbi:hypothetical protein V8F33_007598 [Rhypophila sp. PSN 637]